MNFDSFAFAPELAANIKRLGFETPTPIQAKAIPAILEGRDVVGLAQTGTGKTAAFVLPMLQKLMNGPRRRARALIIGPTRELAEQTRKAVHDLGFGSHLHTVAIYGGVSMRPQSDGVRRGAEIIVACPGRLLDHLRQRTFDLRSIDMLVLDEADQMLDMGFLPDVREIIRQIPAQHQTLLFSATMPSEIRKLANEVLKDPVTIQIARSAPVETVKHALFPVTQHLKTSLLIALLRIAGEGPILVFTRTRHKAKRLSAQLEREGFRADCLQGDMSQKQRQTALDGFRAGRIQVLVATDVAARGIDVSGISHVINFDLPMTADIYIHRIGRTGRAAKTGDAYTLVTKEEERDVRAIERALRAPIERRMVEGFDYGAPPSATPVHPREPHGEQRGEQRGHGGRPQHRSGGHGHGHGQGHGQRRHHDGPRGPHRGGGHGRPEGSVRHSPYSTQASQGSHGPQSSHGSHAPRGSHGPQAAHGSHAPHGHHGSSSAQPGPHGHGPKPSQGGRGGHGPKRHRKGGFFKGFGRPSSPHR